MAAQAVSYLLKPIEVDEFQRVMTQIIAQCDELSEKKKTSSSAARNIVNSFYSAL